MASYGVNRVWSVIGPFLSLHFAIDPELVYTSAGFVNQLTVVCAGAIICLSGGSEADMTYVDGSGFVEEFFTGPKDGKYIGKVTASLMMKDKNTIVIKVASDDLEHGIRVVITTVAQRE